MKITDTKMTSDLTRHTATEWPAVADATEASIWSVTWLPGRALTRNQAITAMTIAEVVAARADDLTDNQHKLWGHIDGWAAELFISGPHAFTEAMLPPEDHQVPRGEWPSAETLPGSAAQRPSPLIVIAGQLEEAYQAGLSQAPATAPETYPGMTGALSSVVLDAAGQLARIRAVLDAFDWETGDRQYALEAIDAIVNEDDGRCECGHDQDVHADAVATPCLAGGCGCTIFRLAAPAGDDDGPEPYCTSCGASVGIFIGFGADYHHYTGAGTVLSRVKLYDAGHQPVIGWREAGPR